jgi:hypothetical protein
MFICGASSQVSGVLEIVAAMLALEYRKTPGRLPPSFFGAFSRPSTPK